MHSASRHVPESCRLDSAILFKLANLFRFADTCIAAAASEYFPNVWRIETMADGVTIASPCLQKDSIAAHKLDGSVEYIDLILSQTASTRSTMTYLSTETE